MCDIMDMINVIEYGAKADGITDNSHILNGLFRKYENIYFPPGKYSVSHTLEIPSGTHIYASDAAEIKLSAGAQKGRNDFLLSASGSESCVSGISVRGGIWNGNCGENDRGTDLFDSSATTGTLFNFINVKDVEISGLTVRNPLCYYMRFCRAENVRIENIRFESDCIIANQDGIHLAGFCSDFIIRNLYGSAGSPNDDFIALNADDATFRQENLDTVNGPQKNILVENVYSEKCHCFVRLLSTDSAIENVTVRNISGACKGVAVCMDAARYCRVPIFRDEDRPDGVGYLRNILLENFSVVQAESTDAPLILLETNCADFRAFNFTCPGRNSFIFANIRKTAPHKITLEAQNSSICPEYAYYENQISIVSSGVNRFVFDRVSQSR